MVLLVFALVLVATVALFTVVPKGFISSDDTGFLNGTTEAAPDISFSAMAEKQKQALRAVGGQARRRRCRRHRGRGRRRSRGSTTAHHDSAQAAERAAVRRRSW